MFGRANQENMKKLFFYTNMKYSETSAGITKKVRSQVQAFRELGYEVHYTAYGDDQLLLLDSNGNVISSKNFAFRNLKIRRYTRRYELILFSINEIKKRKYDLSYLRYHFFDSWFYRLLRQCRKVSGKVIVEMHAYPCLRFQVNRMLPFYLTDKLWGKKCAGLVDRFAAMCEHTTLLGKPVTMIYNAINPNDLKEARTHKYEKKEIIEMIAVGYEDPLHGHDLLIKGIEEYKKNGGEYNFKVHLVGTYLSSTLELIKNSRYSDCFELHGLQHGENLMKLYDLADIAIGTLALHRRGGMTSTSSLKLVEYLCMGLPCVYSGKELMLEEDYPYALQIEDNSQPLDMKKVIEFYEHLVEKGVTAQQIHDSVAIEKNTWKAQMEKVIEDSL
jgi:glycosyltransferase involved in cell wall biosynthesis